MASILATAKSIIGMNQNLAISVGFMSLCCLCAAIARILVSRTVNSPLIKELLYEAIAAAELCACCFELIIGKYCAFIKQNKTIQFSKLMHWYFFYMIRSHFFCYCSLLLWLRLCLVHIFRFFRFAKFCLLLSLWCCCCRCCSIDVNHWNVNNSIVTWQLPTILVLRFMRSVFSFWQFCGQWFGVMQRLVPTRTWKTCWREKHRCVRLCWKHGHNWWAAAVSIVSYRYFGGLNLHRHTKVVHLKAVPPICK